MASVSSATSSTAVESNSSRAQAEARAAVIASLESAGSNYDSRMQRRAADLHTNAAAIAKQEAQVKKNAAMMAKENANLQRELDKTMKSLRPFGDLQNFAETMERDLMVLEETMRLVEGGQEMESGSGGSQWH